MNDFRAAFSGMRWADIRSCLEGTIMSLLAGTANPPPPPPTQTPPHYGPAGFEPDAHPQDEREDEECPLFETGLSLSDLLSPSGSPILSFQTLYEEDIMLPEALHGQEGDHSQEKYLHFELPVHNDPPAAEPVHISYPVAAPQHCNMEPLTPLDSLEPKINHYGVICPDRLSEFRASTSQPTPPVYPAHPLSFYYSRKRQRESTEDENKPYVKKPPNAFMLYMKEQRPNVPAEILQKGSAAVNVFLGQTWRSMSKDEQATYYQQADLESQLHSQLHPEWSTTDNYGKRRRRQRRKDPNVATNEVVEVVESSSSKPPVMDAAPMMMEVKDLSTSQSGVLGMHPLQSVFVLETQTDVTGQTVLVQIPNIQTPLSVSVCHGCYLPQVFMASYGPLMA